jgi:hypothetical protein
MGRRALIALDDLRNIIRQRIPMREALREPKLFGRILQGESWYGWRVLPIASAGEQLADDERLEFKRLTGREREPGRIVRELIAIFGRRAGKSLARPRDQSRPARGKGHSQLCRGHPAQQ